MRQYFTLGPVPTDEDCAQVGEPDYRKRALAECQRFLQLLRDTFGPEPTGAELRTQGFEHDFGRYYEVVVWFDTDLPASVAYACRCDDETPTTWVEEERT